MTRLPCHQGDLFRIDVVRESRVLVFILLVILTSLAVAPRPEGSIVRQYLTGDCRSSHGCEVMVSFLSPPLARPAE
jgi:hypothetical protein